MFDFSEAILNPSNAVLLIGRKIINFKNVTYIEPDPDEEKGVCVHFSNDDYFFMKDVSVEEIWDVLNPREENVDTQN